MFSKEVYERPADFRARVGTARFRQYEWQFLADLDGQATVGEILTRLGLEHAAMAAFIEQQVQNGVIVPSLMTYDEFAMHHGAATHVRPEPHTAARLDLQQESSAAATGSAADAVPAVDGTEPGADSDHERRTPLVFTLSGSGRSKNEQSKS